mgnify:CR=1 FL=1
MNSQAGENVGWLCTDDKCGWVTQRLITVSSRCRSLIGLLNLQNYSLYIHIYIYIARYGMINRATDLFGL